MKVSPTIILLAMAAFLAPISGGQLSLDAIGITDGSQVLGSMFGGTEAPLLGHFLLTFLACTALATVLLSRKVLQVPNNWMNGAVVLFLAIIAASVSYSQFKSVSMIAAVEWLSYGAIFYAAVAATGRQRGPVIIMGASAAGCALVALLGILEYGQNKATDPNWRIFSVFINPNALAAMLLIGFFISLGLILTQDRLGKLLAGAGLVAITIALVLTQSKGALLCLGLGGIVMAALVTGWNRQTWKRPLATVIGAGVVAAVLFIAIQFQASAATQGGGTRLTNTQATAEQSGTYRINLWRGALSMTKANPLGTGIGAYRFDSAKPGITPQTQLAHQSYLQLMAEASPFLLAMFLAIAGLWLGQMFRSARSLPQQQNLLRAGIVSAVVAVGAHSMIDSDFYYFGIGLTIFLLMGVGMLLAADAVAPENLPAPVRYGGVAASVLLMGMMFYFAQVDLAKARLRGAIMLQDAELARTAAASLESLAGGDGEAWALLSQTAATPEERRTRLEHAVRNAPSTKNLRALARAEMDAGNAQEAASLLRRALQRDPNNMLALLQLADAESAAGGDPTPTLEKLIAVEATPYFQVRAIPELVPTETYEARIRLAADGADDRAMSLLADAVAGFARYRETTLPAILNVEKIQPGANYAGETFRAASEKMAQAAAAARRLSELYRERGNNDRAEELVREATKFDESVVLSK